VYLKIFLNFQKYFWVLRIACLAITNDIIETKKICRLIRVEVSTVLNILEYMEKFASVLNNAFCESRNI
jgi:hypothetical protein